SLANGSHTVTLIADNGVCYDTAISSTFYMTSSISAGFSSGTNSCNKTAIFTDASSASNGALTYDWNFGDAGPTHSTAANPSFTYSSAAVYNVSLTVTSISGCSLTISHPVTIGSGTGPHASFTAAA